MRLSGNARAMLTAERSALNTVQHLSGIATMTRDYVRAMGETEAVLLDTRKTIPFPCRSRRAKSRRCAWYLDYGLWPPLDTNGNRVSARSERPRRDRTGSL